MGKEEPRYKSHKYWCPHCRLEYKTAGSIRKHPDHQVCPICNKKPNEAAIIPIDPGTGQPRKGKWVNKCWVPDIPESIPLPPSTNPNHVDGEYGRTFY